MFSEHQGCPDVEIVEPVGTYCVLEVPGLTRSGNCKNCWKVQCFLTTRVAWNWKWLKLLECAVVYEHQGCPYVKIVESVGMLCVPEHKGSP